MSVTYGHECPELGKYSDCHKCGGTGMITRQNQSEPCRRCASAGMRGNWSDTQGRFVSPDEAFGDAHRAKHGRPSLAPLAGEIDDRSYELGVTHGCQEEATRCAALARQHGHHDLADKILNGVTFT